MSYNELPKYNSYTNKPTWLIELWLDNNQCSNEYWLERAQEILEIVPERSQVWTLAEQLKEEHEELNPTTHTGVYSDLMAWALAHVNWGEIASNYLENASENNEN